MRMVACATASMVDARVLPAGTAEHATHNVLMGCMVRIVRNIAGVRTQSRVLDSTELVHANQVGRVLFAPYHVWRVLGEVDVATSAYVRTRPTVT